MANLLLVPAFTLLCIAVANGAITFNNAYIQNVQSGRCATIQKDVRLNPLQADECTCGLYQFWRIEKDEFVMNEDSMIMYMDQLYGNIKPANGETVGIYSLTNSKWQKWRIYKFNDGTYSLAETQNNKCLKQAGAGKIVHWECDDDDLSQRWRIIINPCGERPSSKDRFQLRNPKTNLCAIILNDKDADYSPAGTHKCSCTNEQHYWKFHPTIPHNLQSQGKYKRCMANWEVTYPKLHPGITQCGCANNFYHRWSLLPSGNGNNRLVSQMNGKCVAVGGLESGTPLKYKDCDLTDGDQVWVLHDQCTADVAPPTTVVPTPPPTPPPTQPPPPPPRPINVTPIEYKYFFDVGQMNWLTLQRYYMLVGGRWDSTTQTWHTRENQHIRPNTAEWTRYFGNAEPTLINALFQNGKSTWTDAFGWMNGDFFDVWTGWKTPVPTPAPQPKNVIPNHQTTYFTTSQMNWLNPDRFSMLNGGRWDPANQVWKTSYGQDIRPNTESWKIHFGDATPSLLNALFPTGQTFQDTFSWMTPDFFNVWTSWKSIPEPQPQPQPKNEIPSNLVSHFSSGQMNWMNPDRFSMLVGGRWDPATSVYYTAVGQQIRPSTPEWNTYFGDFHPSNMNILFQNGRSFNEVFGWITPEFFTTWTVWRQPVTRHIQIVVPSNLSPVARQLFLSGNINWLTPGRAQMLEGGQWTGYEFVTKNQIHVAPGSPVWSVYFGNADPSVVSSFFGGTTSFDASYGWVVQQLRSVSGGGYNDLFPWDNIFKKTQQSSTSYKII